MASAFLERLGRLRPASLLALSLALVALIGLADYGTSREVSLSLFYLAPVCLAAWLLGWRTGILLALTSTLAWTVADAASGHTYANAAIFAWESAVRLGFFLQSAYLVARVRAHLESEAREARMDHHTGVLNSRGFYEAAQPVLALSRRMGGPLTLVYLDLDGFKAVNDVHGHREGDELLRRVAGALRGSVRDADLVARLGGDEFALLLPATDAAGARALVDKLRQKVSAVVTPHSVTLSIGVATYQIAPEDLDYAVRESDALMYRAKRRGRNGAAFETFDGAPAGVAERKEAGIL